MSAYYFYKCFRCGLSKVHMNYFFSLNDCLLPILQKSLRRRVYEGLDFETPEYNPSVASMKYVNWTFTVTSPILFLHILFFYLVFTFLFALLLLWVGKVYPKCITVDGAPLSDSPNALADSFALSWTTFSTVVSTLRLSIMYFDMNIKCLM